MLRSRLLLASINIVVLALALGTLAAGGPTAPVAAVDQALADPPLAAPGDWFDGQRAVGANRGAYARAIAQSRNVAKRTAEVAPEIAAASWTFQGPSNVGGRVTDVAVDPKALNTVYTATGSGGVWKSTDAATTFDPAWPNDLTQAIGALAIGGDGVLYAGTGEANPGGGSIVYGGTGIYRSKDGAKTWENVGLPTSGAFGRIAVDPKDPKRVFAAASGNLFVPGGERGLYRSTDGGDTWQLVLAGANATTGAVDIAIDPVNPKNMLATMWDHVRYPTHRVYAGPGSGLYRSTDGGDTWTRIPEITMPKETDNGRIGVAFSPADPNRAYAIIANKLSGTFGAMFRSDDGGKTWSQLPTDSQLSSAQNAFGWWFARLYPDPRVKDRVFATGIELLVSNNGATSFLPQTASTAGILSPNQTAVHADQHAMAWDPQVPGRVYLGNDGGMYRSDAHGLNGVWAGAVDQGWTQHYSVDVGEKTPGYIVTGLQDNRCQRNAPAPVTGTASTWTSYGLCGDGLATLINPADETITYGCSQYGGCGRSIGGAPDVRFGGATSQRWGWFAPLEFDPSNPSVMYFAGNRLNRSTNGGTSWTAISPDLADPEGQLTQLDPHNGYKIRGVITSVAAAKTDPNTIYAGTDNGRLWVTRDLGKTWTELSDEDLPGTWVTRVTVDPTNADVAYATFSSYRDGSDSAHVARTTDGGATWTNISGDLPAAPVNDIVVAGSSLVVATDVGVFLTTDSGATWLRLGGNMPTIPVLDLRYHAPTKSIAAATFGRGIQTIPVP